MVKLSAPGWTEDTRAQLCQLLAAGAGKGLPVVFDFDNTLVCGDIGEATLAMLVSEGVLRASTLPHALAPSFRTIDGKTVCGETVSDLTEYYEALLDPTIHGRADPSPLASGYVWATEVMQGLPLATVLKATADVWSLSRPGESPFIRTPGGAAYPVPFFYEEMLELLGELLRLKYDIWVVSASNTWSVRWTVNNVLNPMLRERAAGGSMNPAQVIGVALLLTRSDGSLLKDSVLVREIPGYTHLLPQVVADLRLSPWLQYPAPTYSGKIAVIWDHLGRNPYLACGDSPGDLPMLAFSQNRLWVRRIDKPRYFESMQQAHRSTGGNWLVQPVRTRPDPGFLPSFG